jgi:hypothetical protein
MKNKQSDKLKRRTQVKDLPQQEKELSTDEQKKVKGGNLVYTPGTISKFDEPAPKIIQKLGQ